eukprot:15180082-Alexandrium_andersonii.AAC.1
MSRTTHTATVTECAAHQAPLAAPSISCPVPGCLSMRTSPHQFTPSAAPDQPVRPRQHACSVMPCSAHRTDARHASQR